MAGWTHDYRNRFEDSFYTYLDRCFVNSKDTGRICLGSNLFYGQKLFYTTVFDALEEDIHNIYCLKSRQLGISTGARALSIFYLGVHHGLRGALVFDTAPHKEEARAELVTMIHDLPSSLKFPKPMGAAGRGNRDALTLSNDSRLLFLSAGVKKSKSSGTLGRSSGLTLAHCSELCSYDNPEGMKSFQQSLSEIHPNRLYIKESTARGYGDWYDDWTKARADDVHNACLFIGWWSKESQAIPQNDPDFARYGIDPPTPQEQARMKAVSEQYGYSITREQLAWIRRKVNPAATAEGDADPDFETEDTVMLAEQAWTEQEAFQQTGSKFFSNETLTALTNNYASSKFKTYQFQTGLEFPDMKVQKAETARNVELKVWDEPDEADGIYVLGVDPAYGENEKNCRSAIQVLRCYADGVDQVAEYAWPLINTRQLAWVIAALLGWYGSGKAEARYILELNGPGTAVYNELRSLKNLIEGNSYLESRLREQGLKDVFRNVKTYIYQRPDSLGPGANYHFKCLALNTPLPTPSGWTTMGNVSVGSTLFDADGQPCQVTGCSGVELNHECYKLVFQDGSSIVADAEHVWPTRQGLLKTAALLEGDFSIPCTKPLMTDEVDLPVHPYVLGVWLGDGSSISGKYYADCDDIDEMSANIQAAGFRVGEIKQEKEPRSVCRQLVEGLHSLLRTNSLLGNKHIPKQYLRGSFEQRLALFQGLMDTDGSIDSQHQCGFNTTIPEVAESFKELLRSLGIKATCLVKSPTCVYKGSLQECKPCHQFWFTAHDEFPFFQLKRKWSRQARVLRPGKGGGGKPRTVLSKHLKIVDVVPVESVPVRCIQVDSPSRLYLAGEAMVPTHNTNTQLKITILERLRDYTSNSMLRLHSLATIDEMKKITRSGDSIGGEGTAKDDRVIALALAVYYWETQVRRTLISQKMTREAVEARKTKSITNQVALFNQNTLANFMQQKASQRMAEQRAATRAAWRYGRR